MAYLAPNKPIPWDCERTFPEVKMSEQWTLTDASIGYIQTRVKRGKHYNLIGLPCFFTNTVWKRKLRARGGKHEVPLVCGIYLPYFCEPILVPIHLASSSEIHLWLWLDTRGHATFLICPGKWSTNYIVRTTLRFDTFETAAGATLTFAKLSTLTRCSLLTRHVTCLKWQLVAYGVLSSEGRAHRRLNCYPSWWTTSYWCKERCKEMRNIMPTACLNRVWISKSRAINTLILLELSPSTEKVVNIS